MGVEGDFDAGGVKMDAVCDDAEEGAGERFGYAEDAEDSWVAMVEGTHGVEEVSYHCCAGTDCCGGLLVGCF